MSSRRNSFSKVPDLADSERRVEPAVVCFFLIFLNFFYLSESDNIVPNSNQLIYNAAGTKTGWGGSVTGSKSSAPKAVGLGSM